MNQYQNLRAVQQITGQRIRLGMMEEVIEFQASEGRILLLVARAEVKSHRYGLAVTKRGSTLYEFWLIEGVWQMREPITVWWSTSDELHTARRLPTEHERLEQARWEDMCHRPGTPQTPLDNSDRRAQY